MYGPGFTNDGDAQLAADLGVGPPASGVMWIDDLRCVDADRDAASLLQCSRGSWGHVSDSCWDEDGPRPVYVTCTPQLSPPPAS